VKVIILAGGIGRRLLPYTVVLPKPLMPVGDYPILEVLIRRLKKFDLTDITLAVGHLGNLIESYFGDGSKWGVKIKYQYEDKPLGTVGPLAHIKGLKQTFLVMNGDLLTLLNYSKLIDFHKKSKALATIAAQKRSVPIDFGIIQNNSHNLVTRYIEKPRLFYQVSMGVYLFEPEILNYIPRHRKFDFPELINLLLQKRKKVAIYPSQDFWLDIGRPDDYARAVEVFPRLKKKLL
jgi:NDP-sugar pyrophosphorylase family protein